MPLLKGRSASPASRLPAPPPPGLPESQATRDEQRATALAEIAEIRRELEAIDQNNSEMESTNMPDNIDTTLSVEEREIIRKFRESHSSAAEQRARFEKVYNTPCGAWTQADFDWMASLMPALLSGKLPF